MANPILFPITYKCNLKCTFCKVKGSEPMINKCLDLIKKETNEWVYITGGEPLLHPDIENICTEIKSYGKNIGITTNGTIKNDRIHLFADRVGVSIDGDKFYHDKYRDNSFESAIEFIKSIIGKVETVLMFTLFEENRHLVNWVQYFGKWLNVDYVQVTKGIV